MTSIWRSHDSHGQWRLNDLCQPSERDKKNDQLILRVAQVGDLQRILLIKNKCHNNNKKNVKNVKKMKWNVSTKRRLLHNLRGLRWYKCMQ